MDPAYENFLDKVEHLKFIISSKPKIRRVLLKKADQKTIKAIVDVVYNILLGNVSISDDQKEKLKKHKLTIRKLVTKKKFKERKEIIQRGGFVPILAALAEPLATLAAGILGPIIGSKLTQK